jgi:phosphoglycolate phosphatase-like HAD superfamily hydrolase
MSAKPTILALDFDGVICDGLREYFQTAWKAYCQIWQPSDPTFPEDLPPKFYRLRPVVETGWEMPVLIRSLLLNTAETEILQNWSTIASQITTQDGLNALQISTLVDGIRDRWIASDVDSWLSEHRFYPGVLERLAALLKSQTACYIISTKEGRFIKQLLQQQGIQLSEQQVYGKEAKRPKAQILGELKDKYGDGPIWFVEDRLKTLEGVEKHSGLEAVTLFLADWGYNTDRDRHLAQIGDRIHLLTLEQFGQDFEQWRTRDKG